MHHALKYDFYSNGREEPPADFKHGADITRFFYLERALGLHSGEATDKWQEEGSYKTVRQGAVLRRPQPWADLRDISGGRGRAWCQGGFVQHRQLGGGLGDSKI